MTMVLLLSVTAGLFGLALGSFAGAQVWRLRAYQLVADKKSGEAVDKHEYARLKGLTYQKTSEDRSRCLSCGHVLAWYDLIPIMSWLSTKGKCRYCHKPIGKFEPLMELGTAGLFAIFTFVWLSQYGVMVASLAILGLWLAALTMFVILFTYDLKWYLLPNVVMFPLIGLSAVISAATVVWLMSTDVGSMLASIAASVAVLAGLYFVLWWVSKGAWVGFGDVKLGVALGILLIDWKLALLTLFLANLIGTMIVLPGLLTGKLSRKTQVPFGPFLIIGFFVAFLWGSAILAGYNTFSTWLSTTMLML